MDYLVWSAAPVGNVCTLEPIVNVTRFVELTRGVPLQETFPEDAFLQMSKNFKKDTKLVDDVMNGNGIKICSKKLVEFLKSKELKNIEYLPVTILDHKKKVASKDYCIVHPVGLQDAIDLKASVPQYNAILTTKINSVNQLIIDESRVDSQVRVFRLVGLTRPVLIDAKLADEIRSEGFVGSFFKALKEVTG